MDQFNIFHKKIINNVCLLLLISLFSLTTIHCNHHHHHHHHNHRHYHHGNNETVRFTEYGLVRGIKEFTAYNNKSYFAFRGIPYAKPPIGELRFRPPQRPDRWNETLQAFDYKSTCIQINENFDGNEDCLYLNVYSPNIHHHETKEKLPVLIGIHGGGFGYGSGVDVGPDFLFNEADMIIVSMNYRLGVFGFLSLNTTEYSGNMGLKDQLLAIHWVRENIHHFGGNSSRITLYGLSAGSASVHLLMLSPVSRSYFQQAILASGSAINPWVYSNISDHINTMFRYANEMGNPVDSMEKLIKYLKTVDAKNLTAFSPLETKSLSRNGFKITWTPVIEPIGSDEAFLTESPQKIMATNLPKNITSLFTYCYGESYLFIDQQLRNITLFKIFDQIFDVQFPFFYMNDKFNTNSSIVGDHGENIGSEIRKFYFDKSNGHADGSSIESLEGLSQLVSDISLIYGIDRSVRSHANTLEANIYYLRFSAIAKLNFLLLSTKAPELGLRGATHADDYFYSVVNVKQSEVNGTYFNSDIQNKNSLERKIIKEMAHLYAMFILNGNPGFKPVTKDGRMNFADITNEGLVESIAPTGETAQFWENLFNKYNMW